MFCNRKGVEACCCLHTASLPLDFGTKNAAGLYTQTGWRRLGCAVWFLDIKLHTLGGRWPGCLSELKDVIAWNSFWRDLDINLVSVFIEHGHPVCPGGWTRPCAGQCAKRSVPCGQLTIRKFNKPDVQSDFGASCWLAELKLRFSLARSSIACVSEFQLEKLSWSFIVSSLSLNCMSVPFHRRAPGFSHFGPRQWQTGFVGPHLTNKHLWCLRGGSRPKRRWQMQCNAL